MDARKQVTHINGKAIIEREPALTPHPNPKQDGRLVETTGVEHVLLDDGSETNICMECGYLNDNPRSVVAHMSGKHSETRGPSQYSDLVLRTIVREVLRAKKSGVRNYAKVAANALNTLGVKPVQGAAFTSQSVSSLFAGHSARFKDVRVQGPRATPAPLKVDEPPLDDHVAAAATQEFDELSAPLRGVEKQLHTNRIARIRKQINELSRELEYLDRTYAELERKAREYDRLSMMFRGSAQPTP